jgi:hypothetical protein
MMGDVRLLCWWVSGGQGGRGYARLFALSEGSGSRVKVCEGCYVVRAQRVSCFVDVLLSVVARIDRRWSTRDFVMLTWGSEDRRRCFEKFGCSKNVLAAFSRKAGAHGPPSLRVLPWGTPATESRLASRS